MRIAVVHSFYRSSQPSGENSVVLHQVEALESRGHEVLLVARSTDSEATDRMYEVKSAARIVLGTGSFPHDMVQQFRPDVLHVHNLIPNFGTHWLRAWKGPLITTIHNFRPVCVNGLLFRDGENCSLCPKGQPLAAIVHGCYQGSRLKSIPLAVRNARGLSKNELLARADRIILLSDYALQLFKGFGLDDTRAAIIPNGVATPQRVRDASHNGHWVCVSRLTPEKGVAELVGIWPQEVPLDIIGSGPEEHKISSLKHPNVTLLGELPRTQILDTLPTYGGFVFPSRCIEMQPTSLVEALGVGLPVIAFGHGAGADIVNRSGCGEIYLNEEQLKAALSTTDATRDMQGLRGREFFLENFTDDQWVRAMLTVYRSITSSSVLPDNLT